MIRVRPARPEDLDEVARIWAGSWASTGLATGVGDDLPSLRARIDRELAADWTLFVAELHGRVAGMLALRLQAKRLDQIFVDPDLKGLGVGSALLAHAVALTPDELWLRTPLDNAAAIAWYELRGFVREKVEPHPAAPFLCAYYRRRVG